MPVRVQTPDGVLEFPDGTTLDEIDEILGAEPPKDARTWTDTAVDALPLIGGMAGGIVGAPLGPLAIGTAAIGGAGGEGFRRAIQTLRGKRPIDDSTSETLKGLATEGRAQGAAQAVGLGVGALASKTGHALYRGLLKPKDAVVAKYGDVVPGLIKRNRLITPGGAAKSKAAMLASRDAADDVVARASGRTPFIRSSDVAQFDDVSKTLAERALGGQADETGKVVERVARLRRTMDSANDGLGLDVAEANVVKRQLDKAVDAAQRAVDRGFSGQLSADDMLNDATRKALSAKIDAIAGTGQQNATTRALAGETTALKHAVKRTGNNMLVGPRDLMAAGMGMGGGYITGDPEKGAGLGILARLLMSPRYGSAAAIGLVKGGKLSPDALRLLRELMVSHDEAR